MYLDLEYETRTNGAFQAKLQQHIARLDQFNTLAKQDSRHAGQFQQALVEFLSFCKWNPVFLTGYIWPAYPKDKPLTFADYPFAFQMFNVQLGGFNVFRGSRQISKSTSFGCWQLLMCRMLKAFKTIYVVSRSQQLTTYANKLRELQNSQFDYVKTSKLRDNLMYKEFPNGSTIELIYALTSADSVRGKSADSMLLDEAQNFDPELELEVLQIQSASSMKIRTYAGTSLTTDTLLEHKWSISSQGSWVIKCECGHFNIPLPEYNVLDMIQAQGPSCSKCGKLLNVRNGKFVHAYPRLFDIGHRGYHIPQIIVPAVVYDPMRWAEIYQLKVREAGSRKFWQEILGIATEEGEKEITQKQLEAICTLGNDLNALHNKVKRKEYRWVVSGCDWGGSDHIADMRIKVSTTVHAVIGITPTYDLDIIHFRRYAGMNYDDIIGDIILNHQRLNGYAIASDTGVGAFYNSKIREKIAPERHLMFTYTGPHTQLVGEPGGPHQYNQWSLNKTESISLTFEAVRRHRLRCFAWELAREYLMDFLNLYRSPGETSASSTGSGATTFIYRSHPSKPNDALMAVNYAYMLAKIIIGEPMFADLSVKVRLESVLANASMYAPGAFANFPGAISG